MAKFKEIMNDYYKNIKIDLLIEKEKNILSFKFNGGFPRFTKSISISILLLIFSSSC